MPGAVWMSMIRSYPMENDRYLDSPEVGLRNEKFKFNFLVCIICVIMGVFGLLVWKNVMDASTTVPIVIGVGTLLFGINCWTYYRNRAHYLEKLKPLDQRDQPAFKMSGSSDTIINRCHSYGDFTNAHNNCHHHGNKYNIRREDRASVTSIHHNQQLNNNNVNNNSSNGVFSLSSPSTSGYESMSCMTSLLSSANSPLGHNLPGPSFEVTIRD